MYKDKIKSLKQERLFRKNISTMREKKTKDKVLWNTNTLEADRQGIMNQNTRDALIRKNQRN